MNLREYLEARLAESKKNKYAFTDEQAMYLEGCEAELESLLDAIKDGELVDDNYKRGVVDGMTASANFVADDFMQGRDNDRMRLADSLRSEAKRVSDEK